MDSNQSKTDNNQIARNYLEDVFNSWEQVSYDENTDTVYRKPLTKDILKSSQELIDKARAVNPDDDWVVNRIKELQDVIDYQKKREYTGGRFIPLFLILFGGLGLFSALFTSSEATLEGAVEWRSEQIIKIDKTISKYENTIYLIKEKRKEYSNWSDEKRTDKLKAKQESIKKWETKKDYLNSLSEPAILIVWQEKRENSHLFRLLAGSLYLLAGIFYRFAFSVPRYVTEKASLKVSTFEKVGDVAGNFFGSLVNGLMSVPDLKIKTTYKDGTSETKTHNPLFWLGAFLMFWVPLLLIVYYLTLAPLAVTIAYLNNYVWHKY